MESLSKEHVTRESWIDIYQDFEFKYSDRQLPFKDLFEKYLPKGGSCFEVGCYPGRFLIYLGKNFDYTVSGIDWMPGSKGVLENRLRSYGLKVGTIIEDDFLKTRIESKYDVVCSFGFIEHFQDIESIFRLHANLLKPNGILMISCPNYRKVRYLLSKWLEPESLQHHNLKMMDFAEWTKPLEENGLEVLHQNYYLTFRFWSGRSKKKTIRGLARDFVVLALDYSSYAFSSVIDYPNSLLSPLMISISKKKA